jgi:hypothetical protein
MLPSKMWLISTHVFFISLILWSLFLFLSLHPCYIRFVTSFKNIDLFVKFMERVWQKKFGKKLVEDWLGNHYCKEFLLELANVVLMKIYYMGVVRHDLVGNYQKVHDQCAIWSAFVWRFGFLFSGCNGIMTFQQHWSCQCLGCPSSHFLYRPQSDDRFWLIREISQYDSYLNIVVYNMMHAWIAIMIFWIGFFKELEFIVIMEKTKSWNYLAWWSRLLE